MVRDLASAKLLAALLAPSADCAASSQVLLSLCRQHGAPLVVKSDNDSAFRGARAQKTLSDWKVVSLLSPPATPQYNGAVEADMGALKARAHSRGGAAWTSGTVALCQLEAFRHYGLPSGAELTGRDQDAIDCFAPRAT